MSNKLKKNKPEPKIEYQDALGTRFTIKAPVLLSIFQSEELLKKFREDPDRRYSVKEIFELRNKDIPVKEPTIRRALSDNKEFFKTTKEIEIINKKNSKTIMVINFTRLKPLAEQIFNAVEELWNKNDDE